MTAPQEAGALTTGTPALDELIDGVRVGDNIVVLGGPGAPLELVGRRFLEAAASGALVVAATEDRAIEAAPPDARLLDHRAGGGVDDLVEALAEADEAVGEGACYLLDSLSGVQERWGPAAALELFLATCPRLFRRHSVAVWLLDADRHDRAFLDRLRGITQVVVELRPVDGEVRARVQVAAGRPTATIGRQVMLAVEDGDLTARGTVEGGRDRLGDLIRAQRRSRGLSQAELARRVAVSPSALSQVERGVRGLSAETLIRIWQALGVPFGPDDTLQHGYRVARRGAHVDLAPASGVTGRELLDDPVAGNWALLSLAPGAEGRQPLFAGKAPEVVLVLRGVLDVEVGGHPEHLQEGDVLAASDALIGAWRNPGPVATELVWSVLR